MISKKKILIVFGTRPEAIKLVPLIKLIKQDKNYKSIICSTGQHKEMLEQVLNIFKIKIDYNLKLMKKNQDLFELTASSMLKMKDVLNKFKPDLVVVQGDTTSAFVMSLAAFYNKIKIAHVEAGLRSKKKYSPFPEELNRKFISLIADLHFAPTKLAEQNLLREGIEKEKIYLTGNTVIDTVNLMNEKFTNPAFQLKIEKKLPSEVINMIKAKKNFILVTMHRREKFGEDMIRILETFKDLADKYPNLSFVYPVHLNPNVKIPVNKYLGNLKNFILVEPLDYANFVYVMKHCRFIMTDSGGIQEEAYVFAKPIMVLRDVTERMEAVNSGYAFLTGIQKEVILEIFEDVNEKISDDFNFFLNNNPFGDGRASEKILKIIANDSCSSKT